MSSSISERLRCGNCNASPADNPNISLMACARCKDKHYCNKDCQAAAWPFHKANCKRPNYIFKVHLCPNHIKDPAVVRVLSVPATASFHALHTALQIAFGWTNTHSYDFSVKDPSFNAGGIAEHMQGMARYDANMSEFTEADAREFMIRISLQEPLTRDYNRDRIWEGQRKHPRTPEKQSQQMKMWQLFDDKEYNDKEIEYVHDFRSDWKHRLTVEGRTKATDQIVCLNGSGHGVAEDVGKSADWEELKGAYRTSTPSREQMERRQWFENYARDADPLGLGNGREHEWSKASVNQKLAAAGL